MNSVQSSKRTTFDEDKNINAHADKDEDLPVLTEAVETPAALPGSP